MNRVPGSLALAALAAAALCGNGLGAQAPAAGASVAVPVTVALERITSPAVLRRDQHIVMMTADVVVGANTKFDVIMRPLSGFDALTRRGVATYVLAGSNGYVPVDGSQAITVRHHQRGARRVSHVVYRFEAPSDVPLDSIDLHVEYDALASSSDVVALRVLSRQRITTRGAPSPADLNY